MVEQKLQPIIVDDGSPKRRPPIIVDDGLQTWVVYDGENPYNMLADLPARPDGVVNASADLVVKVRGWWYTTAVAKVEKIVEDLAIDWDSLILTDAEIDNGSTAIFSKKLIRATGYLTHVSARLSKIDSTLTAAKQAMEHALDRWLAMQENDIAKKPKGSQAMRLALHISETKTLSNTKIEIIELEAQQKALEHIRQALDLHWRTISRAISARAAEPLER